jgi:hypothetical protein
MIWHKKKVERLSVNFHHFKKSCIEGSRLQTQIHSRLIFTVSRQDHLLSRLSFTPDSSSQFHSRIIFSPDSSSLQTHLHSRLVFTTDSSSLQTHLHSRLVFTTDSSSLKTRLHYRLIFTVDSSSLQTQLQSRLSSDLSRDLPYCIVLTVHMMMSELLEHPHPPAVLWIRMEISGQLPEHFFLGAQKNDSRSLIFFYQIFIGAHILENAIGLNIYFRAIYVYL